MRRGPRPHPAILLAPALECRGQRPDPRGLCRRLRQTQLPIAGGEDGVASGGGNMAMGADEGDATAVFPQERRDRIGKPARDQPTIRRDAARRVGGEIELPVGPPILRQAAEAVEAVELSVALLARRMTQAATAINPEFERD